MTHGRPDASGGQEAAGRARPGARGLGIRVGPTGEGLTRSRVRPGGLVPSGRSRAARGCRAHERAHRRRVDWACGILLGEGGYLELTVITFVTPWLAVGGALEAADVDDALRQGITHIVNCRVSFDDSELIKGRAAYLWDPAPDDRLPKEPRWFLEAIEFVRMARRDFDSKVLIHCTGASTGRRRSRTQSCARWAGAGTVPSGRFGRLTLTRGSSTARTPRPPCTRLGRLLPDLLNRAEVASDSYDGDDRARTSCRRRSTSWPARCSGRLERPSTRGSLEIAR